MTIRLAGQQEVVTFPGDAGLGFVTRRRLHPAD
jgi:hypothetical protein